MLYSSFIIERAADIVPLTSNGFPPDPTDAIIPPTSITHLPAKNTSGGVHSLRKRPPIFFAAPIGVVVSTISLISIARPIVDITGPMYGTRFTKGAIGFIIFNPR